MPLLPKRPRSDSVESAASSASKRGTSSPANLANMANVDLNAMDLASESTPSSSTSTEPLASDEQSHGRPARMDPPEGPQQLAMVAEHRNKRFEEGDSWFLIDRKWYRRWQTVCGNAVDMKDPALDGITTDSLGPIDNSGFANPQTGKLIKHVVEGQDVVFLYHEAWHFLSSWYGYTGLPVKREVILAKDGPILDMSPALLKITKVVPANSALPPAALKEVQTSSGWTFKHLKEVIAQLYQTEAHTPIRFWHIAGDYEEGYITAEKLADADLEPAEDTDILHQTELKEDEVLAFEQANEDGTWLVIKPSDADSQQISMPVFGGGGFVETLSARADQDRKTHPKLPSVFTLNGSSSGTSTPSLSVKLRSQSANSNARRGLTGLTNLGNTCFMNSALQCLSNTPSLQNYFLTGYYKQELNPDNPLGMGGEVAKAFGVLMDRIWSGSNSTVTPREFKQTLSKFAPAFSGWQQHDSQELIAFLLDGLHEDLNRIKKKPYDEIPDWQGGGDAEEMHLATLSWELYKRRNDSVIVDLFQGQYRSRLVCPECSKVAIKFDPFMYLSLAIPQNRKWTGSVYLVPEDSSRAQIKVTVEVPANSSFKQLKAVVGELTGYDPKKLFTTEEFSHKFYKIWTDTATVSELQASDIMVMYELPYEVEQPKYRPTSKKSLVEEGKIIVTILHAKPVPAKQSSYFNERPFGEPFILGLTTEEASSVDAIRNKVHQRMACWQGVGEKVWADSSELPKVNGHVRKSVVPEDEDEEIKDIEMKDATPGSASRTPNPSIFQITVNKRYDQHLGFEKDPPSERCTLEERAEMIKAHLQEVDARAKAQMPGGFQNTADEDLYSEKPDSDVEREKLDIKLEPEAVSQQPVPTIVAGGEVLVLEWNAEFFANNLASIWERKRTDTVEEKLSRQEVVLHPAIQNKTNKGQKTATSVEFLLDEFVKEEKLSEDNMWYCPDCKKHQQAQKKFDLWKMPDVLVIHLKRFSNERAFRDKIDSFVEFPIEGLDLSNLVEGKKVARRLAEGGAPSEVSAETDGGDNLIYDLFAVDNHFGGLGGGHYTAFAKNDHDKRWYNFDDSRVSPVNSADDVKTPSAYLLFYCRRTDKIGGKTHEILASRAASPIVTTSELPSEPQSFRTTPDSEHFGRRTRDLGIQHGFPNSSLHENGLGAVGGSHLRQGSNSPNVSDDEGNFRMSNPEGMQSFISSNVLYQDGAYSSYAPSYEEHTHDIRLSDDSPMPALTNNSDSMMTPPRTPRSEFGPDEIAEAAATVPPPSQPSVMDEAE